MHAVVGNRFTPISKLQMPRALRATQLALLIGSVACADSADQGVVLPAIPAASVELVIGDSPEHEFAGTPLASVLTSENGVIAADSRDRVIRMVAADGTEKWRRGGVGDSPDQYRDISILVERDSATIVVVDETLSRATWLDAHGSTRKMERIPPYYGWSMRVVSVDPPLGMLVLARRTKYAGRLPTIDDDSIHVFRLAPSKDHWMPLASLAFGRRAVVDDGGVLKHLSFNLGSAFAQQCDSTLRLYGGFGIMEVDLTGVVRRLAAPEALRYRDDRAAQRAIERFLGTIRDQAARSLLKRRLRPELSSISVSRLVIPDRHGEVWLRSPDDARMGRYDRYAGDSVTGRLHVGAPRFFVDARENRLLAVVPETDSTASRLEVLSIRGGTARSVLGRVAATRCGSPVRVVFN